jgi:putative transposase
MAVSFKGAHFPKEIILMGVRWYLAYPLSSRHVEELMAERGMPVDHAPIQRWVVKYSPLLKEAALWFLKKAIHRNGLPETITIDGSDANEAAIKRYNEEHGTHISIRQVKYLNNVVEQDHRAVKRITRPMLGFKSFDAGQRTLAGIELMHMIKKRQMVIAEGKEGLTAAEQFYVLAA